MNFFLVTVLSSFILNNMSIRFFSGLRSVPSGLEELFLNEKISYNTQQLKLAAYAALPVSIFHLILEFRGKGYSFHQFREFPVILNLILLTWGIVLLLTTGKISDANMKRVLTGQYICILTGFGLLVLLGAANLSSGRGMSIYLILQLYLSVLLWFSPAGFGTLSALAFIVLLLVSLTNGQTGSLVTPLPIRLILFTLTGWFLYINQTSLLMENFYNRISLEDQYKQVATETYNDPLTGLYNRRSLEETVRSEWSKSERRNVPFCLIMLDIDHFKEVNAVYGHTAGDRLLRELADIFRNAVRLSDKVYRYAGETFLILLSETPLDMAETIAERIRSSVENREFPGMRKGVTVSLGVVENSPELNMDILISRVERNLEQAKKEGRNRAVY